MSMNYSYFLRRMLSAFCTSCIRRCGQIPKKDAAELLKKGALVIDVRTAAGIQLRASCRRHTTCRSKRSRAGGGQDKRQEQSAVAALPERSAKPNRKSRLQSIGYKNVFNLGSYERAFRIVTGRSL